MGVFLRWGVFGILAVAGLMYAYNASKRLAERGPPPAAQVASPQDAEMKEAPFAGEAPPPVPRETAEQEALLALPEVCSEELQVAERALKMRRDGEPLDRLLRIDRIAFQADEKRRERLSAVARQWFEREGRDPAAAALRAEVLRDCRRALSGGQPEG